MKTLGKLKLLIVFASLILGMSSCLKKEDSLSIAVQVGYLLQDNYGTYTPQIRIYGTDLIQSATASIDGKSFNLKSLNGYVFETSDSYLTLDTVPAGYYSITATGVNGKTAIASIGFAATTKTIGVVDVTTLKYVSAQNQIVVEADSVENAEQYMLMMKEPLSSGYTMWIPYKELTLSGDNRLSATVTLNDINLMKGESYRFTVGASRGAAVRLSRNSVLEVMAGEDSSI